MNPDLGTPIGHREIIKRINAQKASEAKAAGQTPHEEQPQQGAKITAFRDPSTGQYHAMSQEDRLAFSQHCEGIVADLQPANHRERWLATSIAEDQWRLNRARALESNIFALGMANPLNDVDIDSSEGHAAICQARTWLSDGKQLQQLALYESRIRRSIEKNEKQLKELQTERKAAYNKALEEELLLAQLAIAEGATYVCEEEANGFGFSTAEITRLAHREIRLRKAFASQTRTATSFHKPKAA